MKFPYFKKFNPIDQTGDTTMTTARVSCVRIILLLLGVFLIGAGVCYARHPPTSIAGISLGSNIKSYPEITDTNFVKEVVVTNWHGFRKGIISYGVCRNKDTILKIDMKYADKSKAFYQVLYKKLLKAYGEPSIWNGDSFGVKYIWKWHFIDELNNRVSLTLQHNSKDSNETIGNMLKLSYPEKLEQERLCFMEQCRQSRELLAPERREELKKSDWHHLIPR